MDEKLITAIKLICIVYLIYFLPHIISKHSNHLILNKNITNLEKNSFQVLLSNKNFEWIKNLKLALISDKKPTNQSLVKNLETLEDKNFKIKKIFIPTKLASKKNVVLKTQDPKAKIQTFHWNKKYEKLPAEQLTDIDAIVFDMKNTGIKQSKSFSTLVKIAKIAAENNKQLIIIDKPNPLGPYIEGPGEIPLRHGLTTGEITTYLNKFYLPIKTQLTVVPLSNWERNNIKYAKKQTNGDVSREKSLLKILSQVSPINGLYKSKQKKYAILMPYNQSMSTWEQEYFKKLCLKSGFFCTDYSIITKNKKLNGVKIKLRKDFNDFSIYNTFLSIIRFLNNRQNTDLKYNTQNLNIVSVIPYTKEFLAGKISFTDLKKETERSLVKFYTQVKSCLQYSPDPKIIPVKLIKT